MAYIVVPVTADAVDAEEKSTEVIRQAYPDWTAADADPMTILMRGTAVIVAECGAQMTRVGEELFRYFGRALAGLPPVDDAPATGTVRITAVDANGPYLVPDATQIDGRNALGELTGFVTVGDAMIPSGATYVDVPVEALEEGTASNGITGDADFSTYIDYLTAIQFIGTTSGGVDQEADLAFLDRLRELLRLMTPRPILPEEFAILARYLGAYRATVLDGVKPDGSTGNRATVSVAMVDEAGVPLGATQRNAVAAGLQAMREEGWNVYGIDPTVTPVKVAYNVSLYDGVDSTAVQADIATQLGILLSGQSWGLPRESGDSREWINEPKVRWGDVYDAIRSVPGVRYVNTLGLALNTGTPGGMGVDVTLPGLAPLPSPGVIVGSVT